MIAESAPQLSLFDAGFGGAGPAAPSPTNSAASAPVVDDVGRLRQRVGDLQQKLDELAEAVDDAVRPARSTCARAAAGVAPAGRASAGSRSRAAGTAANAARGGINLSARPVPPIFKRPDGKWAVESALRETMAAMDSKGGAAMGP